MKSFITQNILFTATEDIIKHLKCKFICIQLRPLFVFHMHYTVSLRPQQVDSPKGQAKMVNLEREVVNLNEKVAELTFGTSSIAEHMEVVKLLSVLRCI